MHTIIFHERQLHGVSENHWTSVDVPYQVPEVQKGRLVLKATVGDAKGDRIPSTGRIYVKGSKNQVLHTIDYVVPSVRSASLDAANMGKVDISPTRCMGIMRVGKPSLGDFPGYDDLPASKWFQLNPQTDPYVVQVLLEKVAPSDIMRSMSRGEYFVYELSKVVLRPPISIDPGTNSFVVGTASGNRSGSDIDTVQSI